MRIQTQAEQWPQRTAVKLYRGLALRSQDLPAPLHELTGEQLLDHLEGWRPAMSLKGEQFGGVGPHWTTDRGLAEEVTHKSGHDVRAVLTAEWPGHGRAPRTERLNEAFPREHEVALDRGAPLTITSVEIGAPGPLHSWRDILTAPSRRTA